MAGTVVVQKGTPVKWGTDANTTYGMIQTISQGKGGTVKEYKDHEGSTKTLVIYDLHDTLNITAICLEDAKLPNLGDEVSISLGGTTLKIYIQTATLDWSNEDATRITLSGRTYPTISAT